jgi:hypothetical protein
MVSKYKWHILLWTSVAFMIGVLVRATMVEMALYHPTSFKYVPYMVISVTLILLSCVKIIDGRK